MNKAHHAAYEYLSSSIWKELIKALLKTHKNLSVDFEYKVYDVWFSAPLDADGFPKAKQELIDNLSKKLSFSDVSFYDDGTLIDLSDAKFDQFKPFPVLSEKKIEELVKEFPDVKFTITLSFASDE